MGLWAFHVFNPPPPFWQGEWGFNSQLTTHPQNSPSQLTLTHKQVAGRLAAAAGVLNMPVVVTEQVPSKLGATVAAVASRLPPSTPPPIPKTLFSMCAPGVVERLADANVQAVLLTGIEAHVCVLQTTLDMLAAGIDVHVITDGVSSQRHADREAGLARAAAAGAFLATSEMVLFELARSADHPQFRAISALAKEARVGGVLPGLHGAAALAAAEGASKL